MIKKHNIVLYILLFIEILLFINSKYIIKNVIATSKLFFYYIFPSMVTTMFFSKLLILNDLKKIIPKSIKYIFNKLFNFNDDLTTLYITSMICASPTNAVLIKDYLDKDIINEKQAEILLGTTTFINPLFIISTVGIYIFNNIKVGYLLLSLLYLSSAIKLFINRKYFKNINNIKIYKKDSFISSVYNSINTVSNSLITIFIIIIIFNIISSLLISLFDSKKLFSTIIKIILEITSGIINIKYLNIDNELKILICYFALNFGGICIHMQNLSLINNKKISYLKYLIFRIL